MNKLEKSILEENFNMYPYGIEAWTDAGVDMWIELDMKKPIIPQLEEYVKNFNIDEELESYLEDKRYRISVGTSEGLKDFENWLEWIKIIIDKLKGDSNE